MSASEPPEPDSEPVQAEPVEPVGGRRRWLSGAIAGLAALGLLYYLVTFIGVWRASNADYVARVNGMPTQAAVVLGAAQYNGEPSPVLRARLDNAAELYLSDEVDLVVVTGGGQLADVTTEAKTGYSYLREQTQIPDEQLRLEVQGSSTYESLAATARFLKREGVTHVVLVTDRYHAKRSALIAREVGLDPQVSLTSQPPTLRRLAQESLAVAVGRVISFRRVERL